MTDFVVFTDGPEPFETSPEAGGHLDAHGASHGDHEHIHPYEHQSSEGSEGGRDSQHPANQQKSLFMRLIGFIPDELIVASFFLAVFAVCLAAMLPWFFAARDLVNSSKVSTPFVENGLSVEGSMKTLDPLTLAATLSLNYALVGCTNIGYYSDNHHLNNSIPDIDESLDLFYMDSGCLNDIAGLNWSYITGEEDPDPTVLPQVAMTVISGRRSDTYYPTDAVGDPEIHLEIQEVKPYQSYPFDSYTAQLTWSSFLTANGTINDRSGSYAVAGTYQTPTSLSMKSSVVGVTVSFRIVAATTSLANATSAIIYLNINRSSFSQGLSLFIVIVMWGISLGITVLTLDVTYVRHYKPVSLGMAGLCATMLFALPSLRGVQPGIPPIALYASIDIFSFFMNMALISASLILLLIKIIVENKDPKISLKKRHEKRSLSTRKSPIRQYSAFSTISNTQVPALEVDASSKPSREVLKSSRQLQRETQDPPIATPSSVAVRIKSSNV